jgi:hypothetical protein
MHANCVNFKNVIALYLKTLFHSHSERVLFCVPTSFFRRRIVHFIPCCGCKIICKPYTYSNQTIDGSNAFDHDNMVSVTLVRLVSPQIIPLLICFRVGFWLNQNDHPLVHTAENHSGPSVAFMGCVG